jgi:hypothetical protein
MLKHEPQNRAPVFPQEQALNVYPEIVLKQYAAASSVSTTPDWMIVRARHSKGIKP